MADKKTLVEPPDSERREYGYKPEKPITIVPDITPDKNDAGYQPVNTKPVVKPPPKKP